jgi:hypothetical protein
MQRQTGQKMTIMTGFHMSLRRYKLRCKSFFLAPAAEIHIFYGSAGFMARQANGEGRFETK